MIARCKEDKEEQEEGGESVYGGEDQGWDGPWLWRVVGSKRMGAVGSKLGAGEESARGRYDESL